ncbi:MAG: putative N-acetylmannosamine-6-phosphate 2-epimerase [Ignavibacteria bacterium]|nr:putative N-acetylmannosamine-6-phosphate 2-epimerase [Ignavibacteria bacterium]
MTHLKDLLPTGLVVSCHVDAVDPIAPIDLVLAVARAAELGGAVALRVEGVAAIAALRKQTALPIVGFVKGEYADQSDLITPEFSDIEALFAAGANIVAIDATKRRRPSGQDGFLFFEEARKKFTQPLWADISLFREGIHAAEMGADFIATTLAGYTPGTVTKDYRTPDFGLIHELSSSLIIPVIAEGRIWTPEDALHALDVGAHAVVVGSAITRPRVITTMFADAIKRHVSGGSTR